MSHESFLRFVLFIGWRFRQMDTMTRASIHINVSKIQFLKLMLIDFIFFKFHMILISITTRRINKAKLVIPVVANAMISLRTLSILKVFDTSASIEESKVVNTFLTLVSTQLRKPVVFELASFKTRLLMMMNWNINPFFILETFHVSLGTRNTRVLTNWFLLIVKLCGKFQIMIHFLLNLQFLILFVDLS